MVSNEATPVVIGKIIPRAKGSFASPPAKRLAHMWRYLLTLFCFAVAGDVRCATAPELGRREGENAKTPRNAKGVVPAASVALASPGPFRPRAPAHPRAHTPGASWRFILTVVSAGGL
jgi:hypothetical protein